MAKLAIAFLLAFGIGAFCRYFQIPAPSPPAIPGALLVAAMTLGYVTADKMFPPKQGKSSDTTISSSAHPGAEKESAK
jgi:XapX domain-containing protein